ncbi:hypothetical protein HYN48_09610 [Flavobacterium magnum]|uniref:DUF6671 domain-containing protein n=1 Tax=Flavobacterium magnum TaxID=2162713 RepID=A0A2S0RGT4_9FLAO|nr:DUF6671 family protein [Flavobacterium magnum]AWA30321.1 hypothetical protein HYN48_09610 [Flavobacterium magnum]
MKNNVFAGRRLVITTMHAKESVIAPVLERDLGVHCVTAGGIDTDRLGTFSGEVARQGTPLEVVRRKCLLGMERQGADLGMASEGSFGPHPSIFFAHANEELLMLIDRSNGLEITARHLSLETNFNAATVDSPEALLAFATTARFPSHGLILRKSSGDYSEIHKGITDAGELQRLGLQLLEAYGSLHVETDMRALYNPTRMAVIREAAEKLSQKARSACPGCGTPGYSIIRANPGLPCMLCHAPTRSTLSVTYGCVRCNHTHQAPFPNDKQYEDPAYCDFCNP